jgi:hypothetical protein
MITMICQPIGRRGKTPGVILEKRWRDGQWLIRLSAINLFPRLIPSGTNPAFCLAIENSSSLLGTPCVMLVIALIGMPVVIAYAVFMYHVFKGRVRFFISRHRTRTTICSEPHSHGCS